MNPNDQPPAYNDPADNHPAYNDPAYNNPAENNPAENNPADNDPAYCRPPDYHAFRDVDESNGNASTKPLHSLSNRGKVEPKHYTSNAADTGLLGSFKTAISRLTGSRVLLTTAGTEANFPNPISNSRISIARDKKKQWLIFHYTKSLIMMEVTPQMYKFSMEPPQSLLDNFDVVDTPGTMYMLLCLSVEHTTLRKNRASEAELRPFVNQMPGTRGIKLSMTASVRKGDNPSKKNISIVATLPSYSSPKPKRSEEELQAPQQGKSAWKSLGSHLGKNKTGKGKGKEERIGTDTNEGLELTEVDNNDACKPKFTHTFGFESCSDPKPIDGPQSFEKNGWEIAVLFRLDVDDHPFVDVNVSSELYSAPFGDNLNKSFELTVKEVQRKLQLAQRTGEDEYNDRQECVLECVGSPYGTKEVYNDNIENGFYVSHWERDLVAVGGSSCRRAQND